MALRPIPRDAEDGLGIALRRILAERLGRAIAMLDSDAPVPRRIHQARRRMKEIRAILRLFRRGVGPAARRAEITVRDVARSLSSARDAQAVRDAVERLRAEPELSEADLAALDHLQTLLESQGGAQASGDADEALLESSRTILQEVLDEVHGWRLRRQGFGALRRGLEKAYGSARGITLYEWDALEGEDFHTLRKRVKEHSVHLRVLQPLAPKVTARRIKALSRIADLLGEEHDDQVLAAALSGLQTQLKPSERARLEAVIAGHRDRLRQEVMTLARAPFAEPTADFGRRWRRLWRRWRKQSAR